MVKRFLIIPAIAALFGLVACSKEADSQKYIESAKRASANNDPKAAVIELKNALQKNPEDAEARALLGKLYIQQADPASAEKELRKAIQLAKDKNELLPELAQALFQQGQFKKVLDEIQAQAGMPPLLRARILTVRGNAYGALNQYEQAKTALVEARSLAPDLTEIYTGLAALAMVEQKDSEVTPLIDTAIAKDPQNATAWLMKGSWLQSKGMKEAAIAAYRAALKADPRSIQASSSLANIYMKDGQMDLARAEVAAIKKIAPQHLEGRYLTALMDFREKKFTAARDNLQEILKAAPAHVPSIVLFSATSLALGSYGQAQQHLQPLLQRYPNHAYARKLLATAQYKLNQTEKALETLKPLMQSDQTDPQALALAGELHMKLKQFALATETFARATKLDPQSATTRTGLALSRYAAGDEAQGETDLAIAAGLDTDKGHADLLRAMAHSNKKEWAKALAAVDSLEKKQPNLPLPHNLRGTIFVSKGDKAQARQSFEKALSLDPTFFPAAMNLARIDIQDKDFAAARKRFDSILSQDKTNQQAMLAIAGLEFDAKHEKEMLEWLNKAAVAHPTAIVPRAMLAQHYLQKKDPSRALIFAREAFTANPEHGDALELLGITQMAAGEKDNALATFGKWAALTPNHPRAQVRLGSALELLKKPEAARSAYQKALTIKPDLLDAQVALVRLEFQAGRKAEAMKLVQQIQKQNPGSPMGYLLEGDLLYADKHYDKAVGKFEQAHRLGKSNEAVVRIHATLTKVGKEREAEGTLLQWLKENPQDQVVRTYLADAYLKQKQYKLATEQYQILQTQMPSSVIVLNNLAWAYQQLGDKRALSVAEQANKLAPDNTVVADTLGWILLDAGQVARALPLLQNAFSKHPDNQSIHYHFAVALARNNERARAQSELERLLTRSTQFAEEKEARALLEQLKSRPR